MKNVNFKCITKKKIGSFSASLTATPVIGSLEISYQPNYYIDSAKCIKSQLVKEKELILDFKAPGLDMRVVAVLSYAKLHNRPRDSVIYIKDSLSVKSIVINKVNSYDLDIYLYDSLLKSICNMNHWISRNDCV